MELPNIPEKAKYNLSAYSYHFRCYAWNVFFLTYCRDPDDVSKTASNEAYTVKGGQGEGDAAYEVPDPPSVPPSTSHPSQTTAGDSLYEPV